MADQHDNPGFYPHAKTWQQQEMMQQLALENAKHSVFDKRGIFDGYDPVGYLQCYDEELKLYGVAEEKYIQKFHRFVIPDFVERVEELQHQYSHSWSNFKGAISQEFWDPSIYEADLDYIVVPTIAHVRTQVRAQLEAVVHECLLEDVGLFQAEDEEEIVKAVYAKLGISDAMYPAMSMNKAQIAPSLDLHEGLQDLAIQEQMSHVDEDFQGLDVQERMSDVDRQSDALEEVHILAEAKCWAAEVTIWQCEPVFDNADLEGVQDEVQTLGVPDKWMPYDDELDRKLDAIFSMHADFATAEVHKCLVEGKTIEEQFTRNMDDMYAIYMKACLEPVIPKVSNSSEDGDPELMCILDEALEGFIKFFPQPDCFNHPVYPDELLLLSSWIIQEGYPSCP